MRAGLVLGAVWATKKSPALTGQSLLRVRCGETEYLAADLVGAGPGDRVILAFGAAARAGRPAPCPAASAMPAARSTAAKSTSRSFSGAGGSRRAA